MDCSHVFLYCIWWQCQCGIDSFRSSPLFVSLHLPAVSQHFCPLSDLTFSPFNFNSAALVFGLSNGHCPRAVIGLALAVGTISLAVFISLYPYPAQISYCEFALATILVRLSQLDMAPSSQRHAERSNPPKLSRRKQPAVHCRCFN